MRWFLGIILSLFATLYFLLAQTTDGFLAGFGYTAAALMLMLAMMNMLTRK